MTHGRLPAATNGAVGQPFHHAAMVHRTVQDFQYDPYFYRNI
jgi:hypothetical protein